MTFRKTILAAGLSLLSVLSPLVSLPVMAQSANHIETVPPNDWRRVQAHGVCRIVMNDTSYSVSVPHLDSTEWTAGNFAFLHEMPANVRIRICPNILGGALAFADNRVCYVSPSDQLTRCAPILVTQMGIDNQHLTVGSMSVVDTSTSGVFYDLGFTMAWGGYSSRSRNSCGLSHSGIWCWGEDYGSTPVQVATGSFSHMTLGGCAVNWSNEAWCRMGGGPALWTRVATGVRDYHRIPVFTHSTPEGSNYTAGACLVKTNGAIDCGVNFQTSPASGYNFERVVPFFVNAQLSHTHNCGVTTNGAVVCSRSWGGSQLEAIAGPGSIYPDHYSGNRSCFINAANTDNRLCIMSEIYFLQGDNVYTVEPTMVPLPSELQGSHVVALSGPYRHTDFMTSFYVHSNGTLYSRLCEWRAGPTWCPLPWTAVN